MGRIRLHVALDCSAYSLETFVLDNIEPGATIATDKWKGYHFIDKVQHQRQATNQGKSANFDNLYGVHLVTTLVKRLIRGTYHGRFEPKYLQNYLDEYWDRSSIVDTKSIMLPAVARSTDVRTLPVRDSPAAFESAVDCRILRCTQ